MSRPALFQPGDVVRRQAGQHGQLLAAKAGRPARPVPRQAGHGRADPVPPQPERLAELVTVVMHGSSVAEKRRPSLVSLVPGRPGDWQHGAAVPGGFLPAAHTTAADMLAVYDTNVAAMSLAAAAAAVLLRGRPAVSAASAIPTPATALPAR